MAAPVENPDYAEEEELLRMQPKACDTNQGGITAGEGAKAQQQESTIQGTRAYLLHERPTLLIFLPGTAHDKVARKVCDEWQRI